MLFEGIVFILLKKDSTPGHFFAKKIPIFTNTKSHEMFVIFYKLKNVLAVKQCLRGKCCVLTVSVLFLYFHCTYFLHCILHLFLLLSVRNTFSTVTFLHLIKKKFAKTIIPYPKYPFFPIPHSI